MLLKDAVLSIGDFTAISRGVRFSQKFTKQDIEERWNAILFNPAVAKNINAIPQTGAAAIAAGQTMQQMMLTEDPTLVRWQQQYQAGEKPTTGMLMPGETMAQKRAEYRQEEKDQQKLLMRVEKEFDREKDHDVKALAVLRGRKIRYLMKSKEIVIGRAVPGVLVDVDTAIECPSGKISRRHAVIKLKHDGEFYIRNYGHRSLFTNGREVAFGEQRKLHDMCLIEICDLRFIFEINKALQKSIKKSLQ